MNRHHCFNSFCYCSRHARACEGVKRSDGGGSATTLENRKHGFGQHTLHGQRRGLGLLSAAAPAKDGHRQRGLHGPPQTEGTSFSGFQCSEASGIGLTWYPSEMPRFAARCQLIHEVSAAVFRVSRFRTSLHSPLLRCESRTPRLLTTCTEPPPWKRGLPSWAVFAH